MSLHVGKGKKPPGQSCQRLAKRLLLGEVGLSPECHPILLNDHSEKAQAFGVQTPDGRFAAAVVTLPADGRGNEQHIGSRPLSIPASPPQYSHPYVISRTGTEYCFHYRSNASPWIIILQNLRNKGCMQTDASLTSWSPNGRKHCWPK